MPPIMLLSAKLYLCIHIIQIQQDRIGATWHISTNIICQFKSYINPYWTTILFFSITSPSNDCFYFYHHHPLLLCRQCFLSLFLINVFWIFSEWWHVYVNFGCYLYCRVNSTERQKEEYSGTSFIIGTLYTPMLLATSSHPPIFVHFDMTGSFPSPIQDCPVRDYVDKTPHNTHVLEPWPTSQLRLIVVNATRTNIPWGMDFLLWPHPTSRSRQDEIELEQQYWIWSIKSHRRRPNRFRCFPLNIVTD